MRVTQMNAFSAPPRASAPPSFLPPVPPKPALTDVVRRLLSQLKTDDCILAGIIAVLIFEGCDDYILLLVLGYLFFMGISVPQKN